MIHVVATIELKPGGRDAYLEVFRRNIPNVKAEDGCIAYEPTIDIDSDIPVHEKAGENVVTIVEAWDSLDALKAHLQAPHMLSYREEVKDLLHKVSIRVFSRRKHSLSPI